MLEEKTQPQTKSENDKKKRFLWQYQDTVRRVNRIEAEIAEIRSMKVSPSVINDGMPHGSGGCGDLSGYAASLDRLETELLTERYFRVRLYKGIADAIKELHSEQQKDVLFYRYIRGLNWWEIAERMQFSERQIYRLHGKALALFKIPKDVIECQ